MNQKLQKLVRQLGEAIHESVSESSQIAGVVADIRKQGFEVLLMLEATIGLNEVAQQPEGALEAPQENARTEPGQQGGFTTQDLHFLKSLRISLSGEREPRQSSLAGEGSEPEDA